MLKECINIFEYMYREEGESLILDNYVPKDGTYCLIKFENNIFEKIKQLDIRYDKKTKKISGKEELDTYQDICYYDYYSKLIDMNKPMDTSKIIHSNNYLSLAIKKESIKEGKLTSSIIDAYYTLMKNPTEKYKKPKAKKLYKEVENRYGTTDCEFIDKIQKYVLDDLIWEEIDLERKEYIKIFFVFPDKQKTRELYRREGNRYLIPNIYNNNDFNELDDNGDILGLPNNNMGMNSKKPYLGNKTRKVSVPYLLNQSDVMLQNQFFDYLMALASKDRVNVYIDARNNKIIGYTNLEEPSRINYGYYLRIKKGKEVEIHKFNTISRYNSHLERAFKLKNVIEISKETMEKYKLQYDTTHQKLWELKVLIDEIFFGGKLANNFITDSQDIKVDDNTIKYYLLESRDSLSDWFYCGKQENIINVINHFTFHLILNSIRRGRMLAAQRQFNLRWSLQDYFNNNNNMEVLMEDVRKQLREHLATKEDWTFSSEEEYAYAIGQAVSYLISRSKAKNIPSSLINPFLTAKSHEVIHRRLKDLYKKYNYSISHITLGRADRLFTNILTHNTSKEINREMIMAGFTATSLIYEKKSESEEK